MKACSHELHSPLLRLDRVQQARKSIPGQKEASSQLSIFYMPILPRPVPPADLPIHRSAVLTQPPYFTTQATTKLPRKAVTLLLSPLVSNSINNSPAVNLPFKKPLPLQTIVHQRLLPVNPKLPSGVPLRPLLMKEWGIMIELLFSILQRKIKSLIYCFF